MRILFYSDNFYPEVSGISDSIITLGRELVSHGHTVGFVVPKYNRADYLAASRNPDDSEFFKDFEIFRIPSLRYPGSPSGQARLVVPLGWGLKFAKKFKPDIIHSQSPFGTGFEALLAAKTLGVPIVGTNHTTISEFLKIFGPKIFARPADLFLFWYYRMMKFVSVPSTSLAEGMKSSGYGGDLTIIPNPLSLETFSTATENEKQMLKKEFKLFGPTILFTGRLGKEKQIEPIIRAFNLIKSEFPLIKLVIAGNGPMEESLKDLVRELDIVEKVVFTGFLGHDILSKWYKAADVFSIMCPIETQCLSLMQAFASGLPSVGVNKGGVGLHLKPEFGYVVPEADHEALANALKKILKDPTAAKIMGEKARIYVEQFSQKKVADKWEEVYKQFIK